MINLERDGDVFVLHLDSGENRFSAELCRLMNEALDEVEAAGAPAALVTTGTGKFYSNGLDLEEMMAAGTGNADTYLHGVLNILARVLTFPAVTVAAINGHAFGAGAQMAVGHDYRVMRSDRGFFCMPEVDMHVPLHPFMTEILRARLPVITAHEVIATGRRYGGEDARAAGIVDHAVAEADVLSTAKKLAAELAAKAHPSMRILKRSLHRRVLDALSVPLGEVEGMDQQG